MNEYLSTGDYAPAPNVCERMDMMLDHAKRICMLRGERNGMFDMRKHALWYTKGIRGSNKLRNQFSNVKTIVELYTLAEKVCELENG